MQVDRRDGNTERQILIGMIVSKAVLGPIADRWDDKRGLFASRWANLVASWCVQHFRKNRKAPGPTIQSYFSRWAEGQTDRDTQLTVDRLLSSLSDEFERLKKHTNPGYWLDQASDLFDRVRIEHTLEETAADLGTGDLQAARSRMAGFRPVGVGQEAGVDLPEDRTAVENALDRAASKPLIRYPGALGSFFGHMLGRQQFISFWGREKVGKSFWGMEMVYQAVRQGWNTLYIVNGDMSRDQVIARLGSRAAQRPIRDEYCKIPTALEPGANPKDKPFVTYKEVATGGWGGALTGKEAADAMEEELGTDHEGHLYLSCHPGGTLTVGGMESEIDAWCQRKGAAPDVVVNDYADLFAPIDPRKDKREQINDTWLALSALRLKLDCLVVTLTQADAASYTKWLLEMDNFSDDKRKLSHPTGVVGINQTQEEKEEGLYRLNWVCGRDVPLTGNDFVWTAGSVGIGAPAMFSAF